MPEVDKFLKDNKNKKSSSSKWNFSDFELPTPTKPQRRPGRDITMGRLSETEPATNYQQTTNKVQTEPATNYQQTTNKVQTENFAKEETTNKLPSQLPTLSPTKCKQSTNKVQTKPDILSLVGLQKKITFLIYDLCRSAGTLTTGQLTCEWIAESCESTVGAIKETLRRLEKKGYIARGRFKNGRGGWTIYEMPEIIYKEIFHFESYNKVQTNWQQTTNKVPAKLPTQLPTTAPSSSSNINNIYKETTTTAANQTDEEVNSIPLEWLSINYTPLTKQNCPFGISQINQARGFGMSPEALQESIYHFAWALDKNWQPDGGFQTSPLNFFMGCLKKTGLFEYDGYYRQKKARQEKEKAWLEHCHKQKEEQNETLNVENESVMV